jgi:hypothetical protein
VERSTKKRKPRVKYADRNGLSVTMRIWEDEYQGLLRYAKDIAKIRGMPKRLPIGETIAYMVRYFGAAYKERWEDVLRIAKDEQESVVDHRRFLDAHRKRQSRAKMSNKSGYGSPLGNCGNQCPQRQHRMHWWRRAHTRRLYCRRE